MKTLYNKLSNTDFVIKQVCGQTFRVRVREQK